jgi:DNA-directed RNA polymerase specialized sigma24 family protein
MLSDRLIHNDQEYIDGLLENSPAIIEDIYRRHAPKAKRFILQQNGTPKDAAHIFEETLLDLYYYARNHSFDLQSPFDPFLQLICKRKWVAALEKMGQRVPGVEQEEVMVISSTNMQDITNIIKDGDKRRMVYHTYLQQDEDCQELLRWTLSDLSPAEIAAKTQTPLEELHQTRAACMSMVIRQLPEAEKMSELSERDYELADRLITHDISDVDREPLEARAKNEPLLAEMLRKYAAVYKFLRQELWAGSTRDGLIETFVENRQAWFAVKDHTPSPIRNYIALAALVAISLAGLLVVSPWTKNIYRQFAPTQMMHQDSKNAATSQLFLEAEHYFNARSFAKAVPLLSQVIAKDTANIYAHYYRGVSLVELDQQDAARQDLQPIYQGKSPLQYDAAFYIALSYLKQGNKQQCLEWLLKIPENAPIYLKVQKLLGELK